MQDRNHSLLNNMNIRDRQRTGIMLAIMLTLVTMLAPWTSVLAMPGEYQDATQHQSALANPDQQPIHHAGMNMDSVDNSGCCESGDFCDCDQDCGTCVVTPALVVKPTLVSNLAAAIHYQSAANRLFSNIPPPPNKPPV